MTKKAHPGRFLSVYYVFLRASENKAPEAMSIFHHFESNNTTQNYIRT